MMSSNEEGKRQVQYGKTDKPDYQSKSLLVTIVYICW